MEIDSILEKSREKHLISIGFLKAIKNNFDKDVSFRLAKEGFSNYMVEYYRLILDSTKPNSQERFDRFRKHYEYLANKSSYFHIVESTEYILKVRFDRCPFAELMKLYGLEEFTYAFCLSDIEFTKELLPSVKFDRKCLISKGDDFCDNTWLYNI